MKLNRNDRGFENATTAGEPSIDLETEDDDDVTTSLKHIIEQMEKRNILYCDNPMPIFGQTLIRKNKNCGRLILNGMDV